MVINVKSSLVAGMLAAVGASACCVGPLLLLTLGIGGAWVGRLTVLEPYRPYFTALTVLFIALAFHKLYLVRRVCEPGEGCVDDNVTKKQRVIFWIVAVPVLLLLTFPWYAPLLF